MTVINGNFNFITNNTNYSDIKAGFSSSGTNLGISVGGINKNNNERHYIAIARDIATKDVLLQSDSMAGGSINVSAINRLFAQNGGASKVTLTISYYAGFSPFLLLLGRNLYYLNVSFSDSVIYHSLLYTESKFATIGTASFTTSGGNIICTIPFSNSTVCSMVSLSMNSVHIAFS